MIVFVSKMQQFRTDSRETLMRGGSDVGNNTSLIGFSRVLSGKLRPNATVYVLGARHGIDRVEDVTKVTIKDIYLMMG